MKGVIDMNLKKFCVVWGMNNKSYTFALSIEDAIAKVQADIRVLCPSAELSIKDCYQIE